MRINKSDLMKRAWKTARAAQRTFGGTIISYFAASLKIAWKQVKSNTSQINIAKLAELGNEWTGYGNHRIYFNEIENYFDSICHRAFERRVNGVQVNRAELDSKVSAKVWFDVKAGKFCQQYGALSDDDMEIVKRNILAAI